MSAVKSSKEPLNTYVALPAVNTSQTLALVYLLSSAIAQAKQMLPASRSDHPRIHRRV
jgi:hypothetical protein